MRAASAGRAVPADLVAIDAIEAAANGVSAEVVAGDRAGDATRAAR
jgi:hypothetical protein